MEHVSSSHNNRHNNRRYPARWKVKGALVIGIVASTIIGIPMGVTVIPDHLVNSGITSIHSSNLTLAAYLLLRRESWAR